MRRVAKRLLHTIFVMLGLSVVTFGLLNLAGDPAAVLASPDATPAEIEALRVEQGFDRPLVEQYLSWLGRAIQGDFGFSYRQGAPALQVVLESLPATITLVMTAVTIALLIAIPVGILAATHRGSRLDRFVISLSVFTQSLPTFWIGIVMILIFSVTLRWLPTSGGGSIRHLIMPATALALYQVGTYSRILRSSMAEVLDSELVRTARAKGLREWQVILVHAFKNAALPFITIVGVQAGELLGGTIITETVFAYPGVNRQAVLSIMGRDMPVVLAYILIIGIMVAVVNLLIETLYAVLDPRTREAR